MAARACPFNFGSTVWILVLVLVLVLTDCFETNLVFLDLAVEPWPINAEHVRGLLFVSAGALQRALDHKFFDVFKRHIRRNIPRQRRRGGACAAIIERK